MDEILDLSHSGQRLICIDASDEGVEINPRSEQLINFTNFEEWQKQDGIFPILLPTASNCQIYVSCLQISPISLG